MFKCVISSQLEEDAAHSDFKGYRVLDTSNRYFTPKDGNSNIENLPLRDEVDPHGFLVKAAGGLTCTWETTKYVTMRKL